MPRQFECLGLGSRPIAGLPRSNRLTLISTCLLTDLALAYPVLISRRFREHLICALLMKVLWFSHLVPFPAVGRGVLQRSYHLVRELARFHEVHLLAFVQQRLIQDLLGDPTTGLAQSRDHLSTYCADVTFLPIPAEAQRWGQARLAARSLVGRYPYTIRWLQSAQACAVARQLNDTIPFDVVHFDTISLAPYRKLFTRSVLTLDHHNIESHMMLRRAQHEKHLLKRLYFRQEGVRLAHYERRVCPQFDLNITCSVLDSARLTQVAPEAVVTEVMNGVDTEYFRAIPGIERPNSLVFAGAMSRYANASAMLLFAENIWPLLKRVRPEVTMDVVGGHPPAQLRALAARDRNFRVHGFVSDVRPHISAAAVYVCPIMDGGGTKLKLLDALAMGKAIVAHPIACEGLALRDGAEVMLARDPEEFVKKTVELLNSPDLRERLSRNARSLAETSYSHTVIGQILRDAMEQCRVRVATCASSTRA